MKETLSNFKKKPDPDEPVAAKRKSRFIGELKISDHQQSWVYKEGSWKGLGPRSAGDR